MLTKTLVLVFFFGTDVIYHEAMLERLVIPLFVDETDKKNKNDSHFHNVQEIMDLGNIQILLDERPETLFLDVAYKMTESFCFLL